MADVRKILNKLSKNEGMLEEGNIDLTKRPLVKNPDGSTSTVRSMGVNLDGEEVLIPTVSDEGKLLEPNEAVELYRKTGKHLGKFESPEASTKFAEQLHKQQEQYYKLGPEQEPEAEQRSLPIDRLRKEQMLQRIRERVAPGKEEHDIPSDTQRVRAEEREGDIPFLERLRQRIFEPGPPMRMGKQWKR